MTSFIVYNNKDYDNTNFERIENITDTLQIRNYGSYIDIGGVNIFIDKNFEYNERLDISYEVFETYVKIEINDETFRKILAGTLEWD